MYTLLMVAGFAVGCWAGRSETTNATLTFYVVSESKIERGRFIDTPDLPRVGYIAVTPDMIVTNLQEVVPQMLGDNIMIDKTGKMTTTPMKPIPSLGVSLFPEDAKRFTALTETSIGRRLLVMLGDKPLTAPKVMGPITGGRFMIQFRSQDDLKKLIR